MRSKLTKDANRLREEQKADFENKLHQANRKRQELEDALKKEKAKIASETQASEAQPQLQAAIASLRAEHQRIVDDLLQKHKAELQMRDTKHDEELRHKVESTKKELQERSSHSIDELHRQLADADAARDRALQNEQETKRDAEEALKAAIEKSKVDLLEQHRRLSREAEQEYLQLQQTHNREMQQAKHRAAEAEADLEAFRQNLKAQLDNASAPTVDPQFRRVPVILDRIPDHFKKPRRKVDRRTNSVVEMTQSTSTGVHGSGGPGKENVQPGVRTFSDINALLSESHIGIFNDPRPSSALSDVHSISTPDQRALRDLHVNNTPSYMQVSEDSSSSLGRTQPLADPFLSQERPVSKSQAFPNSASKRGSILRNAAANVIPLSVNANVLAEPQKKNIGDQYEESSQPSIFEDSQSWSQDTTTIAVSKPTQKPKQINQKATADPDLQFLNTNRNLSHGSVSFLKYSEASSQNVGSPKLSVSRHTALIQLQG